MGPQQRPLPPPLVQSVQYFYNPGGNIGNKPRYQNVIGGVIVKASPYRLHRHIDTHQPPAELHAPVLGGYYLGPQQRPLTPPLVQSVQYFYNPGGKIGNKPLDHNLKEGVIVKALPYIRRHCKGRRNDRVLGLEPIP